jgi:hypothetical protein
MKKIDTYLNDCRISDSVFGEVNYWKACYEAYSDYSISPNEYEYLLENTDAQTQSVAKKLLGIVSPAAIAERIKSYKKKVKPKKVNDEFKIKEYMKDGEKYKTMTVEGQTVQIYELPAESGITGAAACVADFSDGSKRSCVIVSEDFFNLPQNDQKFILYHEFAHLRLHTPDSDILMTDTDIKTMKSIIRDNINQNTDIFARQYDKKTDSYVDKELDNLYKQYTKIYENKLKKSKVPISKLRTEIYNDCKQRINNDKRAKKIKAKFEALLEDTKHIENELKVLERDYNNATSDKQRDQIAAKYNKLSIKYTLLYNKLMMHPGIVLDSHLTAMEVDADRYAASKTGNEIASKTLKSINKNLIKDQTKKVYNDTLKEYKKMFKDQGLSGKIEYLAIKSKLKRNIRKVDKINGIEPGIRADIVNQRAKEEVMMKKRKEEEAKKQNRDRSKLEKIKVSESACSNIIDYCVSLYEADYISENCFDNCLDYLYENVYYD